MDLQEAFDRGFEAVKNYLDAELAVLKSQAPIPGERGPPGEPGPPGLAGVGERGEKGEPGRDGRDAGDLALLKEYSIELIAAGIEAVFKAMTITSPDGGRTLVIRVGEKICEIKTAMPLYAGVWAERNYVAGDVTTFGGSMFVAGSDTLEKPGKPGGGPWTLAVKRGSDGNNFRAEEDKAPQPIRLK